MMRDDALFNLRWDAQRTALLGSVASLYRDESFVDVTIVTNGQMFKAHKLLLSASSPYLKTILESVPSHHAVLFMPHLSASDLSNVLKFIYDGEIKINRRALKSFLETAKLLKIKGMDFDFEGELSELDSGLNQTAGGGSSDSTTTSTAVAATSTPAGSSSSARSTSPPSTAKPSTSGTAEDEPPEKMKILPALLLNKKEPQTPDSNYQSGSASQNSILRSSNNNNNNNRAHTSNANLKNGAHEEGLVDTGDEDMHPDMDMAMDDENERSQRMYHMDSDGNYVDIDDEDDEHIQDYEDDDDVSILPEVSIQESDESYSISNLQQLQQLRAAGHGLGAGQAFGDPKAMGKLRPGYPKGDGSGGNYNDGILMRMMREPLLSSKWSPSTSAGGNAGMAAGGAGMGYEVGHTEGVGGLRKTKRYVQCGSCSKVLSSLSALKRHMEDVHCARIQGKCIICGRVYSSRNSLLTHVYSAHKKHEDYKAVARIIRESDFEKFAAA